MYSTVVWRRFLLSFMATLALAALAGGFLQVNSAAREAMSEKAVPVLLGSGDGIIESVFDGWGLSALRGAVGKVFPYASLVLEILIFIFFAIVESGI